MIKFKVFGINVSVAYSFLLLLTFLALIDRTGYLTASILAIIIHELSHIVAMRLIGLKYNSLEFSLGKVKINSSAFIADSKKAIIAVSGPAINILFSFFVLSNINYLKIFGICNFLIGVFNLIPANGLDGGDILFCILKPLKRGRLFFAIISVLSQSIVIFFGGLVFWFSGGNPSLIIVGIYLIILSFRKI